MSRFKFSRLMVAAFWLLGGAFLAHAVSAAPSSAPSPQAGRLVSLGGAVTEIVHALGAGDRLIAVDSTSTYPEAVTRLDNVGYLRRMSAEPILALGPHMVLASDDAGPPAVLDQIRAAGTPVHMIPDEPGIAGLKDKIRAVGAALGREGAADALVRELAGALAPFPPQVNDRPQVLFFLSAGRGAPRAAGEGTSAAAMIRLAGGVNAASGFQGYKSLSAEEILRLQPDYLLVDAGSLARMGGRDAFLNRPAIRASAAAQAGRVVVMDALRLLGFGPRTPGAVRDLAAAIDTLPEREAAR
ncbi:heme/hemin ABC transporter substrate-binding protein [Yunchengibacter salinarum]|uniref:heme/hemin ABC transporter substrate-binding protein n=1 Tax=Yunchengibacter salinarum TaxID=3133399 RepID=UPI0035B61159